MKSVALILALLLVVGLPMACAEKEETPEGGPVKAEKPPVETPEPPEAPPVNTAKGKAVMEASCVTCHPLEKVTAMKMDRNNWENQVIMCTNPEPLAEDDQEVLLDYLAENHGE